MMWTKNTLLVFLVFGRLHVVMCLDNGLARTPPMGWIAWERFKCNTDCQNDPHNCISEKLFMEMADILIDEGYRDAGYQFVNLDDCWMAQSRDTYGNMVPDLDRFPHGIRFLADFMHQRDLKLGIYQDFGSHTCMGYPGIIGHMKQDADTFAKWDVDMVKLDGCHSHPTSMDDGYMTFGNYLNNTKKPMVFSCSWPYYQLLDQMEPNFKLIASHCNMWRIFHDISDYWPSIEAIIKFFGDNQEVLSPYIGHGQWVDPDMLVIGNFHLTTTESKMQMAFWSILPAPLLMSNDLREMSLASKNILLNANAIAVNQDPLGLPGKRIYKSDGFEIWKRPILPLHGKETSFAILCLNLNDIEDKNYKIVPEDLGFKNEKGYSVVGVFGNHKYGVIQKNKPFNIRIHKKNLVFLTFKVVT